MLQLDSSVTEIKGIGDKYAGLLAKMNIYTVQDLIRHYPRGYEEYPKLCDLAEAVSTEKKAVLAMVQGNVSIRKIRNLSIMTFQIGDRTGRASVTVFNMPYLKNALTAGKTFVFYGKYTQKGGQIHIEQPSLFKKEDYDKISGKLMPNYPLTKGITNKTLLGSVEKAFAGLKITQETLPDELCKRYELLSFEEALKGIHMPGSKEEYIEARKRLVFQEFLQFLLIVHSGKEEQKKLKNPFPMISVAQTGRFIEGLPYQLTGAQQKVWEQIEQDLQGEYAMNRLVQGDVGSGKTLVAILALLMTVANGFQGAMMAPTEVLARQHFENIRVMTQEYKLPFRPVLLTGSLTAKEKREAYALMESGEANLIIGTQALFQEKAGYKNLALVITDEQHRFGVKQREALAGKGNTPHILVMSATPIPRTLALILFGDLSVSLIDEYPKNRIPIKNCVIGEDKRATAYRFIEKEIASGRQAYIICPMVEEGIQENLENVVEYSEKIKEYYPETVRIAYLHGKMKNTEKNRIMEAFSAGNIDILVSTTVIEVGIDVPNASVIMIENAERFGLAGLHQLRGRVGRGKWQSYCIFLNSSESKKAEERLNILVGSNDGFHIAEEDMKLRGPGDLFGIRQSGMLEFTLGDIYQDSNLLKEAAECVDYLEKHPDLMYQTQQLLEQFQMLTIDYRSI